jgi:FkbM family methyltransferase
MSLADLHLRLVTGSYTLVKWSRLLNSSWGRRVFTRSYFFYKRHMEDPFFHLISRHPELFRGGHVIDVGANIGYTAAQFALATDSGFCVYAFEPEDLNFALLTEMLNSFHLQGRIVPVHAAVGASDGTIELARNESHPADHRVATSAFRRSEAAKDIVVAQQRSIDSFVEAAQLGASIRFIKIDVQGYEPAVCWGMERTLQANPACTVVLEYAPSAISALGFDPSELLKWFRDRNYQVHTLHRNGTFSPGIPDDLVSEGYGDLLFSRSPERALK